VKTQVWIAISIYVLVAIVKKELELERSLSEIFKAPASWCATKGEMRKLGEVVFA
jgi:hypothetical protein